ncbi:MAG: efflux RND transporter periplasmic adaptor subunit [Candidatus Gracilibacteria bacterium]|nr:efflux RND transporter periplasmic adaptor subunit [Candidatus Gracilibacteria bacterium]
MKKILIITLFLSIFLVGCNKDEQIITKNYSTNIVGTGSIENNNTYVGYIKSDEELNIAPKVGGKVILLKKEVGDNVKSGELIAQLDGSEANSSYNSSTQIIKTLNELKDSTLKSYDKQIESNKEKINQLNKNIANSGVDDTNKITIAQIKTVENQIIQAQNGVEMAKLNLENNKTTLEQKEIDIYTNSNNAINSSIILGNNLIDFFDNIYGATQKNKKVNDNFEKYLSAKNSKIKDDGEILLLEIIDDFEEIKDFKPNNDKNYTLKYLNLSYELFNTKVTNFLNISYKVMENTVENVYFPGTQINEIKKQITDFQTKNQGLILTVSGNYIIGLKGSIDNINNFENQKKQALDMLEKQVINAESQLNILNETLNNYKAQTNSSKTQISSKLDEAKKYKEILESQLNETNLGIEALNQKKIATINEIETQIAQIKSGKNTSGIMIENSKVYAGFDGIITQKFAKIGQVIGAGTPIYQISSIGDYKIDVQIGEELEKNLKIGDEVNIEVDGKENIVKGKIKNI